MSYLTVPWNLTSDLKQAREARYLVVSVGKSGRTWFRFLVNRYLALHHQLDFTVADLAQQSSKVPSIFYTHDSWENTAPGVSPIERLLGKHLVTKSVMRSKPVILLFRDPRDIVVSYYFHTMKRARGHKPPFEDIGAFIRDPGYGLPRILHTLNGWRDQLAAHPSCLWLCYEELMRDTQAQLEAALAFLGIDAIDQELARQAVEFAAFENMKEMERSGSIDSHSLRPGDPSDPQSFKVREGKVGGFMGHLSPDDLGFSDEMLARLDPFYVERGGYLPSTASQAPVSAASDSAAPAANAAS